jgi:hypothetical protein
MMGQLGSEQDKLFYSFNVDNHVPRERPLLKSVNSGSGQNLALSR